MSESHKMCVKHVWDRFQCNIKRRDQNNYLMLLKLGSLCKICFLLIFEIKCDPNMKFVKFTHTQQIQCLKYYYLSSLLTDVCLSHRKKSERDESLLNEECCRIPERSNVCVVCPLSRCPANKHASVMP